MTDREKVIKGLECCNGEALCIGEKCPYFDDKMCVETLHSDTLALLKAQEPIEARLNLCESCTKEYPECDATIGGMEFGCGVGNDNIIGCTAYANRWKAQEPRLMTLEEVCDEAEYMYLEKHSETGSDLYGCAIRGDWDGYGIELLMGEYDTARERWSEYGKRWRCWTSRHDEKTRGATPWE